jgi:hypothetical protein
VDVAHRGEVVAEVGELAVPVRVDPCPPGRSCRIVVVSGIRDFCGPTISEKPSFDRRGFCVRP